MKALYVLFVVGLCLYALAVMFTAAYCLAYSNSMLRLMGYGG